MSMRRDDMFEGRNQIYPSYRLMCVIEMQKKNAFKSRGFFFLGYIYTIKKSYVKKSDNREGRGIRAYTARAREHATSRIKWG